MRILNVGSLNIDHVYGVDHAVRPGETEPCSSYHRFCGGKGLNQSIALARAGLPVFHAGRIGTEGGFLRDYLSAEGVDTCQVRVLEGQPTGHAIIQVDPSGQNAILVHGGANQGFAPEDVPAILAPFGPGDGLLVQNETNEIPAFLREAKAQGLTTFLNPAPMSSKVGSYPLEWIDFLFVNETEGAELSGQTEPSAILGGLRTLCPGATLVLTLGADGAWADHGQQRLFAEARKVQAVDTTAAGDTFIGYFIAAWSEGKRLQHCLERANQAAAICVTRSGAAASIPLRSE